MDLLAAEQRARVEKALADPGAAELVAGRAEFTIGLDRAESSLAIDVGATAFDERGDGDRRAFLPGDLDAICKVAAALPEVDVIVMPAAGAAGLGGAAALRRCLRLSGKHVHVVGVETLEVAQELLAAARSAGEPSAQPPLSASCAGADPLQSAAFLAREGVPVGFSTPPTAALMPAADDADYGTLVGRHAGVLVAFAALRAAVPDCRFITPLPAAAAEPGGGRRIVEAAAAAGLPVAVAPVLSTAAATSGWRAGSDKALALLDAALVGGGIFAAAGALDEGRVISPTELVLDAEVMSWVRHIVAGIEVNDDALALDDIAAAGVGGNHLARRRTRREMKAVWRPRVIDRSSFDAWEASGRRGAVDLARERAAELARERAAD